MKTFKEYMIEAVKKNKIEKVIVKGLERYIVQGSENGEPYVIISSGEKRIGKEYFKDLKDEDYFKSEKDAKKYINEGFFSKEKDEDWDFTESVIIMALKNLGKKPKGKLKDKTSSMLGATINMWQFVDSEFSYEDKIKLRNFLNRYKFKQNPAAPVDDIEGTFTVDDTEFHFSASDYFNKKGDGKAYMRIYKIK